MLNATSVGVGTRKIFFLCVGSRNFIFDIINTVQLLLSTLHSLLW